MQKTKVDDKIVALLADQLGLETDDISKSDSFSHDLHMSSVDLADFAHTLEQSGYSITPDEISKFETVEELVEFLFQEDNI